MFRVEIRHPKRQRMTAVPNFFGQLTDLRCVLSNLTVQIQGAPDTIAKAGALITRALASGQMTPGEASKLRGLLGWLEGTFAGKPLSGATSPRDIIGTTRSV